VAEEPRAESAIEAVLEQVEGQRPGRDEDHHNPDRPVIDAVIGLVAGTDAPVMGELDGNLLHGGD